VHWGGGGERITNSSIDGAGTLGMPANARAAINLTVADGSNISNNRVANAGYIGIRVFRNATVAGNTVSGACFVLTDCGGLFTSARDRLALNTRMTGNRIDKVGRGQRLAWAIYLGDYANAVTIDGNTIADSGNGMQIYNGYGNTITGNTFSGSGQSHVQMVEAGAAAVVRNNAFSGNTFNARAGEENYRISSDLGSGSVAQFGTYSANNYLGSPPVFANFNGDALSFAQWKARTGQDAGSTQAP
jgi:parallel beta-helix repeat protein